MVYIYAYNCRLPDATFGGGKTGQDISPVSSVQMLGTGSQGEATWWAFMIKKKFCGPGTRVV